MKRKITIVGLAFTLLVMPVTRLTVQAQSRAADAQATKVKAEVAKRVANKKTKVKVKLRSGEQLKGQIDQSDDSGFTITQDKTNSQVKIPYADVEKVSGRGGLSTAAKVGIIAGIAIGVLAIVVIVAVRDFDPFSGGITVR
jgi:small nuclear ribonucleoprotein (snRNP)-like protein